MAGSTTTQGTYALIAELALQIESYSLQPLSQPIGPERVRRTTIIHLSGGGEQGTGEDATPIEDEQLAFQAAGAGLELAGEWTIDSFTSHVATLDLVANSEPMSVWVRSFRQWAFESAALDLALRQAGRSLADVLGRPSRPLTFVNSMHLADPPSFEPIRARLELFPALRFKLDPTSEWDERLFEEIAATGAVDTADLKSQYPPPYGQPADPRLCARVVEAFPQAWIEDPAITSETWEVLESHGTRITWDAPLRSLADLEDLATRPRAINIKPVRFGRLQTLLAVYDHCLANDIAMYGGGFGELGVGRRQIQYLASLFHPDTPNDVAPSGYNLPELDPSLPTSPLTETPARAGFDWARCVRSRRSSPPWRSPLPLGAQAPRRPVRPSPRSSGTRSRSAPSARPRWSPTCAATTAPSCARPGAWSTPT
jgi:L-alanine-DL-glutamate epimerase-like enolase superfamily enzyme